MEQTQNSTETETISRPKKVKNQNGQLILQVILDLNRLCTFAEIVEELLIRLNRSYFEPHVLKAISYILKKAVRFGFIQMLEGRYFVLYNPASESRENLLEANTQPEGPPTVWYPFKYQSSKTLQSSGKYPNSQL